MQRLACGTWPSPLDASLVAKGSVRLLEPRWDGAHLYWIESRPSEGGRGILMRWDRSSRIAEITPPPYHVRTTVHEYGGGAYTVADGVIFFSHFDDQRVYRQDKDAPPRPLTPEPPERGAWRYADFLVDKKRQRLYAVTEIHFHNAVKNALCALDAHSLGKPVILAEGHDFYSTPRLSPDGAELTWLTWDHPNMPWDGSELWTARFAANGLLEPPRKIAGGQEESIVQPEYSPDGRLFYISDRTDFWNLYVHDGGAGAPFHPAGKEFTSPLWVFGMSSYAFTADGILALCTENGGWSLVKLHGKQEKRLPLRFTSLATLRVSGNRALFLAGSPADSPAIVVVNATTGEIETQVRSHEVDLDPAVFSVPESFFFETPRGKTHAFYYPPHLPDVQPVEGETPPLIVISHGGPTGATSSALDLELQFWTTRGFGVVDVNYSGSTGFGRKYRNRLRGGWGVVDVEDCISAARALIDRGKADPKRLAIRGGSAGGYTTLCALVFHDVFAAGASYFGVSDIEALRETTHKFESRYDETLIGEYPKQKALYRERSPIHSASRLRTPILLLQGLEDKVVPPDQSKVFFEAAKKAGVATAYLTFEGEQHGFRRAENIQRALEAEFYFYSRIFGFRPHGDIAPITIENEPPERQKRF